MKMIQNKGSKCQNDSANPYFIDLYNQSQNASDRPSPLGVLAFTGEFIPCSH